MQKATLGRVYVWEIPVRFYHWLNAFCLVVLCVTGYLIGAPLAIQQASEASFSYWFGKVRFIHFVSAYIFFFNFLFRIYWGFVGNRYANWKNFIPFRKKQWKEIKQVIAVDILQADNTPIETIGHNAVAGFTYFMTFLAFLFQCVTGFGLYAAMSKSWFPQLVRVDRAADGRRFCRAPMASRVHVVFHPVRARPRLHRVLSRLRRRPRRNFLDGQRLEIHRKGISSDSEERENRRRNEEMNLYRRAGQKPLILGVGNLLMGDEGVGVAAIRHLEEKGFADRAELVDGGTSGFHLLGLFRDQQHLILIDAATDGKPAGTVSLIRPRYASDFPPTLTAHDIGLKDLIESAALLGYLPEVDLITDFHRRPRLR